MTCRPTNPSRSRRHAFTLVELLVVIGIIALLIAVLLPALRRARDQANKTACMSNLRQIAMGFMLYASDNKDYCPWGSRADNPGNADLVSDWIHYRNGIGNLKIETSAILKSMKIKGAMLAKLVRCPSDTWEDRVLYQYSYSMNMFFDSRPGYFPAEGGAPIRLSTTRRASEKILLAEENEKTINDGFWAPGNSTAPPSVSLSTWVVNWDWLSIRHDNSSKEAEPAIPNTGPLARLPNKERKGLVVFADGHVDFVTRSYAHDPSHLIPRHP